MSHSWKNILVSPSTTLRKLLTIIDEEALKLALVVNEDNQLLGSVSDGDIRRALIGGNELSALAKDIMHKNPITADVSATKEELLTIIRLKELLSIPITDNGKVVGLETIHSLMHRTVHDNPVFIMAGGFGTRLKPLTDNCPKPLLNVGDKPILEILLLRFINSGFHDFYISTHYLPEMIREYFGSGQKWGVNITYVHESQPLGTGGALGLLPKDIPDLPLIVINGDVLTKIDFESLLDFHTSNAANATMSVREYDYQVPFGVVESEGHHIKGMVEKPVHRFHVNAGIYVISQAIVKSVKENESIDMPTLLERHLDDDVLMYPFHEYWLDIGRIDDFNRAQNDIKTLGL
ncbi:MAG: dTDP-glucose pyrophosphorylase [Paraglaciecola sp.]|jgi:dTDP-glucose pyrophosphorylase